MNIEAIWEILIKFIWPLAILYAGYLHRELSLAFRKIEDLTSRHFEFKAQISKDYATHATVRDLENRLTDVLNRIDDKVTRILERERNG